MLAYVRYAWSEHWLSQMREARNPEDFWRYSVLFSKIVDGRSDDGLPSVSDHGEPFRMFWPGVESQLKHRCEKWRNERKKKLFGDDAPSKIFISPT